MVIITEIAWSQRVELIKLLTKNKGGVLAKPEKVSCCLAFAKIMIPWVVPLPIAVTTSKQKISRGSL